ncbi:MAG: DUF885 family protein [Woeseiaceae bacterium]|nr:DUF885 family protein [Woeseiaceae bacterium]
MPMRSWFCLLILLVLANAASAREGPAAALDELIADYWAWYLEAHPLAATRLGVDGYNDRLPAVTADAKQTHLAAQRRFLDRLRAIDRTALPDSARQDAALLAWELEDAIRAGELGLERIPFNTFSGFFMDVLTMGRGVAMTSVADYEDYLVRLAAVPRYFAGNIANMRTGSETGFVLPRIVIDGILPTLVAQQKDDPAASSLFDPLRELPGTISRQDQERLRNEARHIIATAVLPAFAEVADFLRDEYAAADAIGATRLPGGAAYYAFQIRRYTTLIDASAAEIHAIGLAEVERIRADMLAIIDEVGFDGGFDEFTAHLRSEPRFFAESEEELLAFAAYTAKRIDYLLPGYFGRLPRQPYGIVPVPAEIAPNYTTGAYYGAPLGGSRGGAFWINTYGLDQRPLYAIPALTLHEAVPGHHLQGALALEMTDVPAFRRALGYSAFGEGWALYAEKLGVEMGVYRTPYEHFGRLSYEMWRACRLVIDTGIHALGWQRAQAIDYLLANTALSAANARAEIDRYISWPAQALAYKLGELEIQALRQRAEDALGERFDLREFHDVVLGGGEMPLALLAANVERYIARRLEDPG